MQEAAAKGAFGKTEVQPVSPAQTGAALHVPRANSAAGRAETLQRQAFRPIFKSPAANSEKCKPLQQHELKSREKQVVTSARVNLKCKTIVVFAGSSPIPACLHQHLQVSRGEGSGTPQPPVPARGSALIFVMSVRGWEDARKSKILWISQKGKKKAGVRLPAQARAGARSGQFGADWASLRLGPLFTKLGCDDSFSCCLTNFLPALK